jgi:hypothetical protein
LERFQSDPDESGPHSKTRRKFQSPFGFPSLRALRVLRGFHESDFTMKNTKRRRFFPREVSNKLELVRIIATLSAQCWPLF